MEKIIVWGMGKIWHQEKYLLELLEEAQLIKLIAIVDRNKCGNDVKGIPVIKKEEICNYKYDTIVIMAGVEMKLSILGDIAVLGINMDSVTDIRKYSSKYSEWERTKAVERQKGILREILLATDEQVTEFSWMLEKVKGYGIYPGKGIEEGYLTKWSLQQDPYEFAMFCCYLAKMGIEAPFATAMEIGCFRGRSSYFICAVLARNNEDLQYDMVDICDRLDSFEEFQEILPGLVKRIPMTSDNFRGKEYDFVFIDGNHTYEGSIKDYINVGQFAKRVIVFHDIYVKSYRTKESYHGGVPKTWDEVLQLTANKDHKIFGENPKRIFGIGMILV